MKHKSCKVQKVVVILTYYCDYLEKEFTKELSMDNIYSSESECELCGSHGKVTIDTDRCECGRFHSLIIKEW